MRGFPSSDGKNFPVLLNDVGDPLTRSLSLFRCVFNRTNRWVGCALVTFDEDIFPHLLDTEENLREDSILFGDVVLTSREFSSVFNDDLFIVLSEIGSPNSNEVITTNPKRLGL